MIISLACTQNAAQAEKSIKEDGLNWTHGFVATSSPASLLVTTSADSILCTRRFRSKQREIPLTFLIGPDGRMADHDMLGNDPGAVGKALRTPSFSPLAAEREPMDLPQCSFRAANLRSSPNTLVPTLAWLCTSCAAPRRA